MTKNLHVVPHEDGWAIKQEGEDGTVSVHSSQSDAVAKGEKLAADREVNLVVHRADGAFDHVEKFTDTNSRDRADQRTNGSSLSRSSDEPVRLQDVVSVGSRVSWGALLAGVVVALTIYVSLGTLGVAIGLSTAGLRNVDGGVLALATVIWAAISLLVSLFLGGFVTSRSTVGERKDEAMIYGVLLWGTLFLCVVALSGMGLRLGVGGMFPQIAGEVTSTGTGLTDTELTDAGLSAAQIEDLRAIQNRGGEVRATSAAWWTFATLIVSMIASIIGSLVGAGPHLSLEDLRKRRGLSATVRA